ncbi:MAG: M48 family metallopeptidase [Betaproteobacteria bacterium]
MQFELPFEACARLAIAEPPARPVVPVPPACPSPPAVYVRHPRARRYIVCVRPDGTVRVTIPRGGSKREARAFAEEQRAWIDRQLRRLARERERARGFDRAEPLERILEWRARASRELPIRLLELAARHGLAVARVSVRNQRSRWGSCSRGGHICLNWRLVLAPDWVRDYVMIHELMHLKRMDHSPKFWRLVAAACPEYEEARRWLRREPAFEVHGS